MELHSPEYLWQVIFVWEVLSFETLTQLENTDLNWYCAINRVGSTLFFSHKIAQYSTRVILAGLWETILNMDKV